MFASCVRVSVAWAVPLLACTLAGCGAGHPEGTVAVSGVVTLDGKPLEDASIAFLGKGGARLATAQTDKTGKFTIRPAAGNNTVSVSKGGAPVVPPSDADMLMPTDTEFKKLPVAEVTVPEKYSDPTTSGIAFECVEGMEVDIALSSK